MVAPVGLFLFLPQRELELRVVVSPGLELVARRLRGWLDWWLSGWAPIARVAGLVATRVSGWVAEWVRRTVGCAGAGVLNS